MRNFKNPLTYALYLLELRDRSFFEISSKMRLKKFSEKEIVETVKFLKEKKFLDDEKFAKNLTQSKILSGEGKQRIKFRLVKLGIDQEIIEHTLENYNSDVEQEKALEIGQKIYARNAGKEKGKLYQKIMGALYRKGYDLDTAKDVVAKLLEK